MANSATHPPQPLAAGGATLNQVLRQAGVTKDSIIRVTGPAGLAAIIWLCRHGYEQAAYLRPGCIANTEPADVLLIPHLNSALELADLLERGDCLHEGGVLIAQTPSERSVPGGDAVARLLQTLGYELEHHIARGRDLYVARRRGAGVVKKAA